ncbi:MAG TPA: hypothetical protein VGL93_36840 [Streptosporangiaceae bacterium]|jgi:hypothetical protein
MPLTTRVVVTGLAAFTVAAAIAVAAGAPSPPSRAGAGTHVQSPVTAAQAGLLERAEQELIRRCMARAGFRYWPVGHPADPVPFRYVVDDVAWAGRYGYGTALRRAAEVRAAADPNRRYFTSLPPARQAAAVRALDGTRPAGLTATLPNGLVVRHSDRGCDVRAQRTLYGNLPRWYASTKITENLPGQRYGLVVSDPRWRAATPAWSACMRRAGYPFATPDEAHAAVSAAPPAGGERRQAVAEARCAVATGLGALAGRLDREHAARQARRYRVLLAERDKRQRQALPTAERVVAGH